MICGKCGEDIAYRLPPDYIDYCPECGVIEGLDNTEIHNV
jgi:Zn-finger nucleic acid-binding protein